MRVKDILATATTQLASAGIESARMEARLLLCWAAHIDRTALLSLDTIDAATHARFITAVTRRVAREPYAYITGSVGFWDQILSVEISTLIPRADSETLITALTQCMPMGARPYNMLDLGTGTGCLLLAALGLYPKAKGLGIDRIHAATLLARHNARQNGVADRASFMTGNWADAVSALFDVVLSNPPYIRHHDMARLMPEVRDFEPESALDGGVLGLDAYRAIIAQLPRLLTEDGIAIFELGIEQADGVCHLASLSGLREKARFNDLGGVTRALVLEKARR